MNYAEAVFEDGTKSVLSYDSEDELKTLKAAVEERQDSPNIASFNLFGETHPGDDLGVR